MKIPEIDAQLAEVETSLAPLCDELEKQCSAFITATIPYIQDWYSSFAERSVTSQPAQAKELGAAGLSKLKASLKQLREAAPTQIQMALAADSVWVHRMSEPRESDLEWGRYFTSSPNSRPKHIDAIVRRVQGALQRPLENAGLSKNSDWEGEFVQGQSGFRFRGWSLWSDAMNQSSSAYDLSFRKYIELMGKWRGLQRQRAETEARELWDKS